MKGFFYENVYKIIWTPAVPWSYDISFQQGERPRVHIWQGQIETIPVDICGSLSCKEQVAKSPTIIALVRFANNRKPSTSLTKSANNRLISCLWVRISSAMWRRCLHAQELRIIARLLILKKIIHHREVCLVLVVVTTLIWIWCSHFQGRLNSDVVNTSAICG